MKDYKSEEEFLAAYNPNEYDLLSVATDILIFSISTSEDSNYRKKDKMKMSLLLVKRDTYPFKDKWCLPGGFIGIDENLDDAPKRILKREANIENIYLEQLYTYGSVDRDPRMRVISTAYMALIDKEKLNNNISDNASWFDIVSFEEIDNIINIKLDNGNEIIKFSLEKKLREKTTDRYPFIIKSNPSLAFDNPLVILSGIERLKNKIEYTDIVFNMMPKYFTLGELQRVYEVILNKKLLDPAFRRIIAHKVEKTDIIKNDGGHRPSYLYKYKDKK